MFDGDAFLNSLQTALTIKNREDIAGLLEGASCKIDRFLHQIDSYYYINIHIYLPTETLMEIHEFGNIEQIYTVIREASEVLVDKKRVHHIKKITFSDISSAYVEPVEDFSSTPTQKEVNHPIFGKLLDDEGVKCDVFIIMPFSEEFKSIYEIIVDTIQAIKIYNISIKIKRADQPSNTSKVIMQKVWSMIYNSDMVIAICTPQVIDEKHVFNPNVLYELGIAHAIEKESVIVINKEPEKLPFDIKHLETVEYVDETNYNYVVNFKKKLTDIITTYFSRHWIHFLF